MSISAYGMEDESTTYYLQEHDNHFIAFLTQRLFFKGSWGCLRDQSLHLHKVELYRRWPSDPGVTMTKSPCYILRFLNSILLLTFWVRINGCQTPDSAFLAVLGNFDSHGVLRATGTYLFLTLSYSHALFWVLLHLSDFPLGQGDDRTVTFEAHVYL